MGFPGKPRRLRDYHMAVNGIKLPLRVQKPLFWGLTRSRFS